MQLNIIMETAIALCVCVTFSLQFPFAHARTHVHCTHQTTLFGPAFLNSDRYSTALFVHCARTQHNSNMVMDFY